MIATGLTKPKDTGAKSIEGIHQFTDPSAMKASHEGMDIC
jgi:hypothetical protein